MNEGKLRIADAYVTEGHLYAPRHSEDGTLVVCDFGVGVDVHIAGVTKRYAHNTYKVKGYVVDEVDGFSQVDWQAEGRAKAFAERVRKAGVIDLRYWHEIEERDLQSELAAEAEREAHDRLYGCGDYYAGRR